MTNLKIPQLINFQIIFLLTFGISQSQNFDDSFPQSKMQRDLEIFYQIRKEANSGLYQYRTTAAIDSIYDWAFQAVKQSNTYGDFYKILLQLTDFEGSCHNDTNLPKKINQSIREETSGYFPYPIKWIDGKWRLNFENAKIPLGSEIISINGMAMQEIIPKLHKYYTTDGYNISGKRIGIRGHFSPYYRYEYGLKDSFTVEYSPLQSTGKSTVTLKSVGYRDYYKHVRNRYSKPYDHLYYYHELPDSLKYEYKIINTETALLTLRTFDMGNEESEEHKKYVAFLERTFANIHSEKIQNLIVDIRDNTGGTDPNDVVTYSYLTDRVFQESKECWISFQKVPLLKYYNSSIPSFLRPLGVGKYNRWFQKRFPYERNGRYYINDNETEKLIRKPNPKAFKGNIYLLINPAVASAASLFGALVASNSNTRVIGEESLGGYYGHNGHSSLEYKLPYSKIVTDFSVENVTQDVSPKVNQPMGSGIIPDYEVHQSLDDYFEQIDTQLNFTLDLIRNQLKKPPKQVALSLF